MLLDEANNSLRGHALIGTKIAFQIQTDWEFNSKLQVQTKDPGL
jgi:hypothetical protein